MPVTFGWNGYVDWARELSGLQPDAKKVDAGRLRRAAANAGSRLDAVDKDIGTDMFWEPLFVQILDGEGRPVPASKSDAFFRELDYIGLKGGLVSNPIDLQFNSGIKSEDEPAETVIFRQFNKRDVFTGRGEGPWFKILAVGGIIGQDVLPRVDAVKRDANAVPTKVMIGIIDDAIGVLHSRFRSSTGMTRIKNMLWLVNGGGAGGFPVIGGVLTDSQINAEIGQSRLEHDYYKEISRSFYDTATRHSLLHAVTHGTHILDLAAGADLGTADPMEQVPILAVQTAPQSFDDTSGTRVSFDIVIGLQWMILNAAIAAGGDPIKLIVNVSLGWVAGPKNGRSFIEQRIERLIVLAEAYFGVTVHVLLPYGNAYSDNMVARSCLAPKVAQDLNLRLLPDDRAPTYLELRLTDQSAATDPEKLEVTITPPRGGLPVNVFSVPAGSNEDLIDSASRLVGRLYHVPERNLFGKVEPAYLLLALAPTVTTFSDAELTCPSGQWKVAVKNKDSANMDLTMQVQRSDNPFPRKVGARQARLEGEEARVWELQSRSFKGVDATAGRITRAGTNSALSTVDHPRAISVGGSLVRYDPSDATLRTVEPAHYYTAEGADWSGGAPDLSALSETTLGQSGLLAAGQFSAANGRLSGSSTAAPTVTRDLVLRALGETPLPDVTYGASDPRLGNRTILDNPAVRRRP